MKEFELATEAEIDLFRQRLGKGLEPAFLRLIDTFESKRDLLSKTLFLGASSRIFESGWRSSEILRIFFDVVLKDNRYSRLKKVCKNIEFYSGFSNDPLLAYLSWIRLAIDNVGSELIDLVEEIAAEIHRANPYSSKSLTSYFESIMRVSEVKSDQKKVASCLKLTKKWSLFDRIYLEKLFTRFEDAVDCIELIEKLDKKNPSSALQYLERIDKINEKPFKKLEEFDNLLLKFADEEIADFLDKIIDIQADLTIKARLLLKLGIKIRTKESLLVFFENYEKLPLEKPDILSDWLNLGLEDPSINDAGLKAYVGLESHKSREALDQLLGEISLAAHRQTLDLLAKAISAQDVLISEIEEESDKYNLMRKAGEEKKPVLFLPHRVSEFGSADKNFSFYKVSLFHQIGFREFGCVSEIEKIVKQINTLRDKKLARFTFMALESARIDWRLKEKYPGLSKQIDNQREYELVSRPRIDLVLNADFLELIHQVSLGLPRSSISHPALKPEIDHLYDYFKILEPSKANVDATLKALMLVYELLNRIETWSELQGFADNSAQELKYPEPVKYRGSVSIEMLEFERKSRIVDLELPDFGKALPDCDSMINASLSGDDRIEVGELKQAELGSGVPVYIEDAENVRTEGEAGLGLNLGEELTTGYRKNRVVKKEEIFQYEEWDFEIKDYRPSWCTLRESRTFQKDLLYFTQVVKNNADIIRKIRKGFSKIRPQSLRKVRGVMDGEELNIERTIAYFTDKKAGGVPDESIYEQKQRVERDVATLFLIDMSASTDDIIYTTEVGLNSERRELPKKPISKRIIDVEKEAVCLLSEVLEELGDAYSICGFSGYGREQVDYYRCKGFDKPMDDDSRAKLGGLSPCRSTRMGPSIRHAIRELVATGSRTKSLIIISDGYPQDHDYGPDRNSKTYGLMDTMRALSEARSQDISSFCLTVDPSGNDYLRDMCPQNQYMVIKDVSDLPGVLSKVYLSLTG